MHNRSSERIRANLVLRFPCCNTFHPGTVTNLSEKGMFIHARQCLPFESQFDILFRLQEDILNISVKVRRIEKKDGLYDGMGVELLEYPRDYLEFVKQLKSKFPSF